MNIVNSNHIYKSFYTQKAAFKANIPDTSRTLQHIEMLGLRSAFETAITGKSEKGVNRQLRKIQSFINKSKENIYDSSNKISDFILRKAVHRMQKDKKIEFSKKGIAIIVGIGNHGLMKRIIEMGNLPVAVINEKDIAIIACHDEPRLMFDVSKLVPPEIYLPKIESDFPLGLKNNHEAMKPVKPTKINMYKRHFGIHNRKW